ncbi:MAG TPA: hypothetical protein VIL04_05455 [Solirubrobacterales bacterium]|jgi:hypothetical protein
MKKLAMHAVLDRVAGERPGAPRAAAVAASVGLAAAAVVYKALRHESSEE